MTLFVPLDTAWPDSVKVIRVGLAGAGLHAMAMCIAKRTETDGVLHRSQLYRLGASDELIDLLLDEGLLDGLEYGSRPGEDTSRIYTFRPHDWHDRNPSQGAIDATRSAKKDAAKEGNHRRWNHPGEVADCPRCNHQNTTSSQGAIAPDRTASPQGSPQSESESESESCERSPDDGFSAFWLAYPRKSDRKKALTVWRRLNRSDRIAALVALPNHAAAWKREHPDTEKYIPHPTTWLNGRRWEDQVSTPKPSGVVAHGVKLTGANAV